MHGQEGDFEESDSGPQQVTSITVVLEATASKEVMAALWENSSSDGNLGVPETVSFDGKLHTGTGTMPLTALIRIVGLEVDLEECQGAVMFGFIGDFLLMLKTFPPAERLRHYRVCLAMRYLRGPKGGKREFTRKAAKGMLREATTEQLAKYASLECKRRGEYFRLDIKKLDSLDSPFHSSLLQVVRRGLRLSD
jgi:hypothetical protein